jgi:hypothetical protein
MSQTLERLTPDPEQEAAIERMVNEPTRAAANCSVYGTGKSLMSVEVGLRLAGNIQLIVAPLFTKHSWKTTILRQNPDARVEFINSSKEGTAALNDLLAGIAGWYIIGREYFATNKIYPKMQAISPMIDYFVYDEVARWSNRKSRGFAIMKKIKPKYKMALSATPAGNRFDGMFAITMWLWPQYIKEQTGLSYWRWVKKWCRTEEDFFAGEQVVGELNPGEYVAQLPCYIRLEADFGESIRDTLDIELSRPERAVYDRFEKDLIVWLQENAVVAKVPIVKRIRLRQMSLGTVAWDKDTDTVTFDTTMRSTKYDTLKAIIKENPEEPMLILTHSAKFARVVVTKLKEDGYAAEGWHGEVPEATREETKRRFMDSTGVDYIVATIASIGEGVDGLQARSRFMVWLSRDDDNQLNEQAFRRLYRRGQERQVLSIDIAALETYDHNQLSNLIQQTLAMNSTLKRKR